VSGRVTPMGLCSGSARHRRSRGRGRWHVGERSSPGRAARPADGRIRSSSKHRTSPDATRSTFAGGARPGSGGAVRSLPTWRRRTPRRRGRTRPPPKARPHVHVPTVRRPAPLGVVVSRFASRVMQEAGLPRGKPASDPLWSLGDSNPCALPCHSHPAPLQRGLAHERESGMVQGRPSQYRMVITQVDTASSPDTRPYMLAHGPSEASSV